MGFEGGLGGGGGGVEGDFLGVECQVFMGNGGGGEMVFPVADDGVAGVLAVDADLVGATGFELDFEQGCVSELLFDPEAGFGGFAVRVGSYHAFAGGKSIFAQGVVDQVEILRPVALDEGEIAFVHGAGAELALQVTEKTGLFGDDEAARGFPVETMDEFGFEPFGAGLAQGFDQADADATAAVDRQTGGFVKDKHGFVFEQDALGEALLELFAGRGGGGALVAGMGWNPHLVAFFKTGFGLAATAVDAHFAAPDQAVDSRSGQAPEFAQQEIIQPLA